MKTNVKFNHEADTLFEVVGVTERELRTKVTGIFEDQIENHGDNKPSQMVEIIVEQLTEEEVVALVSSILMDHFRDFMYERMVKGL